MDLQHFTKDDIACNDGIKKSSVWIIVNKKVYNVTDFLDEHPGGRHVIMEYAGKDATNEFKAVGHSSDAQLSMKKYLIGELVQVETKSQTEANYGTVNESVTSRRGFLFCCKWFGNR